MEENKDYQVYRFDYLTEGSQLKLEHNVYCEDVDISSLITQGADALEALRQDSIDGEQKALAIVQAAAKQWEQQAAVTQKLNRSLEYLGPRRLHIREMNGAKPATGGTPRKSATVSIR